MTLEVLRYILTRVKFQDWVFTTAEYEGGVLWLQVSFFAKDNADVGWPQLQKGRKWLISRHMTEGEVIQTALKAILTAQEHEVREQFLVDGVAIFGPHLDIQTLVKLATNTVHRKELVRA